MMVLAWRMEEAPRDPGLEARGVPASGQVEATGLSHETLPPGLNRRQWRPG